MSKSKSKKKIKDLRTKQEILEFVLEKLLKQGHPAANLKTEECAYRTAKGDKCAIGMLIPNKAYESRFEDSDVMDLMEELHDRYNLDCFRKSNHEFLCDLQRLHDEVVARRYDNRDNTSIEDGTWDKGFFDNIESYAFSYDLNLDFLPELKRKFHA